jgi:hemoglobin-like flavoprotein
MESVAASALAEAAGKRDMNGSDFALLEDTFARAANKLGDITPLVYARLFAALPETEILFARDTTGAARGAMLSLAIEMAQDLVGPCAFAAPFIAAERVQHEEMGIAPLQFALFFTVLRDTLRAGLGAEWPNGADAAWARVIARAEAAASA